MALITRFLGEALAADRALELRRGPSRRRPLRLGRVDSNHGLRLILRAETLGVGSHGNTSAPRPQWRSCGLCRGWESRPGRDALAALSARKSLGERLVGQRPEQNEQSGDAERGAAQSATGPPVDQ